MKIHSTVLLLWDQILVELHVIVLKNYFSGLVHNCWHLIVPAFVNIFFLIDEFFLHHMFCFIFKNPVNSEEYGKIVYWVSPLFMQMDKRKDPSSVDIKQVLLEMRKYRMGLIQTADQLRFSYLAVTEGAKFIMGDSSVQVSAVYIVFNFNHSL